MTPPCVIPGNPIICFLGENRPSKRFLSSGSRETSILRPLPFKCPHPKQLLSSRRSLFTSSIGSSPFRQSYQTEGVGYIDSISGSNEDYCAICMVNRCSLLPPSPSFTPIATLTSPSTIGVTFQNKRPEPASIVIPSGPSTRA